MKSICIFLTTVSSMIIYSLVTIQHVPMHKLGWMFVQLLVLTGPFIYLLKERITTPMVEYVHDRYLPDRLPDQHTVPLFVMTVNSCIVTLSMIALTQFVPHNAFFDLFFAQWTHKLMLLLPLFFFVIRPFYDYLFEKLDLE